MEEPKTNAKLIKPSRGIGKGSLVAKATRGDEAVPLTVFKASAGSGKTFTLAVEYIKLLIADPGNFRYILAVTFTNKATQEMKQRILSKLYGIAHSLADAEDYLRQVENDYPRLGEKEIRRRADMALQLLVHNYNLFRVETIDSFFQRVLRNLAHELGLTANLQVSLNDNEVESEAVDNIIEGIESEKDPLLTWIMDFVRQRMEDDKSWNVIGRIKDFGKNVFTDFYKDHQQMLKGIMDDAEFFRKYTSALYALKTEANKEMAQYASLYEAVAQQHGLTDDLYLYGHSNVPGYFERLAAGDFIGTSTRKIPNSYVANGMDNPEKLVKRSVIGTTAGDIIMNDVAQLLAKAEEARKKAVVTVNSVDLTLQNVNELRLLGRIEKEVREINAANNDYLLSNTQKLLNSLIDKQDSPFIYEKIGGQLRYIMIDEFQDTSVTQWDNFKVLLDDCIAHQAGSLIVGDVKQSIYRWRNGDWRLLQGLNETRYPEMLKVRHLDTNYRSQRNIIDFNNAFFKVAAGLTTAAATEELAAITDFKDEQDNPLLVEAASIKAAYEDVGQAVPANKPTAGLVNVALIPNDDYDNVMIQKVKETVERLVGSGIPVGKIAIIVRKNKHIKLIADYFLHHALNINGKEEIIKIVSDEAFRLDASLAVNIIVKAMHWLMHPDDKLTAAFLAKAYTKVADGSDNDTLFINNDDPATLLPEEMTEGRTELLSMPLIDMAERIFSIFHLEKVNDQSAYVCAFFDQLSAYLKKHIAGIDDFLEEWDENLCSKSIHSDVYDGIRMLTVHKSKGLEFDNVIIPFCDWDLEDARDLIWAEPKTKPFSDLPFVPLHLQAQKMKESIYSNDYESEHIKNLVDNLNILYVAFTRASRNLFVFGKKTGAKYPSKLIADSLENEDFCLPDGKMEKEGNPDTNITTYRYGSLCPSKKSDADQAVSASEDKDDRERVNIFDEKEEETPVQIENFNVKAHFIQSNASADFMTPDDELEDRQRRQQYIDTGNILHALFASIHNYNEVDAAIDQLEFDGVLYDKPMTRGQLRTFIEREFAIPQIRDWFDPRWTVFNECSILYYDEEEKHVREQRPDRVIYDGSQMIVIDFKTGRQMEKHKGQVRSYMRLLNGMGYGNVRGFLWYIRHNNIIEVIL